MAKIISNNYKSKPEVKRPRVHAKSETSILKASKNYTKKYKGQGR